MEISRGGIASLHAYSATSQVKRNNDAQATSKPQETPQTNRNQANSENNPIAGSKIGSVINTSA